MFGVGLQEMMTIGLLFLVVFRPPQAHRDGARTRWVHERSSPLGGGIQSGAHFRRGAVR